ncbi:MAG: exodeoxyribonuclease VII small subunit [Chloroflexi bacterium GWC2_73_18]|nr:MAG: exodeoxyribonuclease VII small subunit [Chloroflexi bacterium GWC2_73_18]
MATETVSGPPGPETNGAGGSADPGTLPFDRALAELQETVTRLESGGLPLEEAITLYERGVALHERCARLLADAELRVQRLVERAGGALQAIELSPDDQDG